MRLCWVFVLVVCKLANARKGRPCQLRKYPAGYVCVCDEKYCDTYEDIVAPEKGSYILTSTSEGGLRFKTKTGSLNNYGPTNIIVQDYQEMFSESSSSSSDEAFANAAVWIQGYQENFSESYSSSFNDIVTEITLNENQQYQKIIGFGGGFTGAVSYILENITESLRHHIYDSYYSTIKGIGYNMMRVIIGGCDFDLKPWTYAEEPAYDTLLSGFTKLNKEDLTKIKQYRELERVTNNYNIKKVAAAWSSPRWMKSNDAWNGSNHLLPQYYETWANYYLRWLNLMDQHNMKMWGLSTGNEPADSYVLYKKEIFLSLGFTAYNQGIFVGENLGPLIQSSKFNYVNIIGFNDERIFLPWWLKRMDLGYHNATSYLSGIGVHWYFDLIASPSVLTETHNLFPNKFILYTESCFIYPPVLGEWIPATLYFDDISENFGHFNQGWIDWNLILDEQGGPNYLHHYISSSIIVNTTSGTEFYKQPSYYAIGHFSKFLLPDSVRIASNCTNKQISTVSFKRPDGCICIIFYNQSDRRGQISITDNTGVKFILNVPPKSMNSLMYQNYENRVTDILSISFSLQIS